MGAMTTMRELAAFWDQMTAEERIDYRVRFGDDVFEVIAIDVQGDQAMVRGYQLNGPMAQTQRDDKSRAARVKIVAITQGGVEILDRDEPVESDDPGPPPTLRLAESGELEKLPEHETISKDDEAAAAMRAMEDAVANSRISKGIIVVDEEEFSRLTPGEHTIAGVRVVVPDPKPRAADTPVEEWASTAIRLPHELLQRGSAASKQRMIGRNVLFAHLIEQGLNDLEDRPVLRN